MLCRDKCPRGTKCKPISNVVADDDSSFVCIGYHSKNKKDYPQDKFRHCFKSAANTDSMFDYDEYDIKSVISVMSEALLTDELSSRPRVNDSYYLRIKKDKHEYRTKTS